MSEDKQKYFCVNKSNLNAALNGGTFSADHITRLYQGIRTFSLIFAYITGFFLLWFLVDIARGYPDVPFDGEALFAFILFTTISTSGYLLFRHLIKKAEYNFSKLSHSRELVPAVIDTCKYHRRYKGYQAELVVRYHFTSPKSGKIIKNFVKVGNSDTNRLKGLESQKHRPALVAYLNDQVYELI